MYLICWKKYLFKNSIFFIFVKLSNYSFVKYAKLAGFPQGLENLEKYNFLEKSWKVMELWKIIKSHGKVMEFRKSHTDKSSPSIRNLALIRFASHLVSCNHSNTSDSVFALRFQNLLARNSSLKIFKHEKEEKLAGLKGKLAGPAQFLVAEGLGPALNAKAADYELLGEFEANPLVYWYSFLI